jgi:hypothetical protein
MTERITSVALGIRLDGTISSLPSKEALSHVLLWNDNYHLFI